MTTIAAVAALIGYIGTLGSVVALLRKLWRTIQAEKNGIECLLRSRIREIYYHHADEEHPCIREYERQDLDELYRGYTALGGNTFVVDLYDTMRDWKVVT